MDFPVPDIPVTRTTATRLPRNGVEGRDHGVPDEIPRWDIDPAAGSEPDVVLLPKLIGSGFELSSSEARRLIKQGGVKLDGDAIAPDILELPREALDGKVLQVGKRRFLELYDSAA